MKILIVGFSESIHVARWINQLKDTGWQIYLFPSVDNGAVNPEMKNVTVFHSFYGSKTKKNKELTVRGIPVASHLVGIVFRMLLRKASPDYQKKYLKRVIRKIKPDIIHSMEIQHAGYLVNDVKKKWRGKLPKWIATNWGSDIYFFQNFPKHLDQIHEVLNNCDYYSCECNRDVGLAKKHGLRGRTLNVFPNSGGFDLKKLKSIREKIKPSRRKAIVVKGYQGWAGRAQVALHALDKCGELIRGYELIIYSVQPGSGVNLVAEYLAHKYDLKLTIVPLCTPHEQILRYHSSARISIGLSISDAISTLVLESMVTGSFPIQSDTSCAGEWIESGKTGMIVPAEDPQVIEKAIRKALTDDALVDRAASLNWKSALKRLDEKIIKKNVIDFYKGESMKEDKVFVTGVFGSGKTTFAKKYAKENKVRFISFDRSFSYRSKENQSRKILKNLPERVVMDAIPIDEKASWADFIKYEKKHDDVSVVCVYCPSMSVWLKRVGKRAVYYKDFMGALKCSAKKALRWRILPANLEELNKDYRNFFTGIIPSLKKFKNVKYYDSCANEYTTLEEMKKRIKIDTFPFQDYLQNQPDGYDKYYQDIEAIGLKGYSESYKTWDAIENLVSWKNKQVIDLGCSHGYFCFKAEDAGGKVRGFEKSPSVIKTAERINKLRGGKVKFSQWEGGKEIPRCDIILCLNVLHHFRDPEDAITKMNGKKIIFEIKKIHRPLVEKHLKVIKSVISMRSKRIILLCEPKKRK